MIELRNITKDYDMNELTVHALKGISIRFRASEFVAVLGPSGCGKTTLLNIIGGLDHYSSGDLIINEKSTVDFNDRDWDSYRNHSVGFIFQTYNLIPHQDVISNVELALTIAGVDRTERRQRAREALEKVGLGDQLYKKPNQLSGGQMQRVAIARALINNPDILLADEPTGALDTQSSLQIMELLKEIAQDRLVIMVTHNAELADAYASRIVKLKDGLITSDSNPITETSSSLVKDYSDKPSMGILTALSLSLNNLLTKKGRTILVAMAGSIGIIGIALIMSLSNGVNRYIDEVQKNSLSSYPLSIENSDVDMTSTMMSMMGTIQNDNKEEGKINEVPVVSDLFNQIGTNNLKAFKKHLEDNSAFVDPLMTAIDYSYGVTPQIFKKDTSKGAVRLNPSSMYSGTTSTMATYSFRNTFQEMIDNQELLREQYDLLAGKWPETYDELVLIIYDRETISDYMLYALGIRDPQDLQNYISKVMSGEKLDIQNTPLVFTLEDFLGMEFVLVKSTDYYQYDSKFDIWKDMQDDDEHMTKLVSDSEVIHISGVIAPKAGTSSTVMSPGVGYLPSLSEHLLQETAKTEIVRQQLAARDIDVFTRKTFEQVNSDEKEDNLDFQEMISVDRDKLQKAFGGKVDANKMQKEIVNYINEALNSITTDASSPASALKETLSALTGEMLKNYVSEKGMGGMAMFGQEDIETMVATEMALKSTKNRMSSLEKEYGIPAEYFSQFFSEFMNSVLQMYYSMAAQASGMEKAALSENTIDPLVSGLMNSEQVSSAVNSFADMMLEARMKSDVAQTMGNMSSYIVTSMSQSFRVDADLLKEAFSFDLDEDELSRIMQTYMKSGRTDVTCASNLRKLGYYDKDDPVAIAFYIKDFDSKETFKDFIAEYNKNLERKGNKDDQIIYTDITGILISSVSNIINAISYILIAFVSVSLVVSSIMIGIITYISVLERTKEIGILRSLGASKANVANVFNAETFIIGFIAGLFGVITTMLLCIPINIIVRKATGIPSITAYLPISSAAILVAISVILTIIAGLLPARMAAKRDPVTALRTE